MRAFAVLGWLGFFAAPAWADGALLTYPGAVHTRIAGEIVIRGEHYRLAYFLTRDPMKAVARWFVRGWEEQGYPVTTTGDFVSEATVSAFYTRDGVVRSIVLRRHEGQTLGFTALKDLWVADPPATVAPRPKLEGALWSSAGGEGRDWHRTAIFEKTVAAARDHLAAAWAKAGYTRLRETPVEQGGRVLELQKGTHQLVVSLIAIDAKMTGVDELELEVPQSGAALPDAGVAAPADSREDECGP